MKQKDDIAEMFRSRLEQAQMEVRDGFWDALQSDLAKAEASMEYGKRRWFTPAFYRTVAAASVLLVLGISSVLFWHIFPNKEIQQAFVSIKEMEPPAPFTDVECDPSFLASEQLPVSSSPSSFFQAEGDGTPAASFSGDSGQESVHGVSVHISFTFRQQMFAANKRHEKNPEYRRGAFQPSEEGVISEQNQRTSVSYIKECEENGLMEKNSGWAWKMAVGTALPKGDYRAPLVAGVTVERRLNHRFSLETGLQYHGLFSGADAGEKLHVLAVPVKVNIELGSSSRWVCYATLGGSVEKILNKGFGEDPLRLSASVGAGVAYRLNDKLALFAEPALTHYFDTDTHIPSLRTVRDTNMNLLCGVRMTY